MIRLLRLQARHEPTPLVLPLLAVLLGITPLFRGLAPVALWLDRSVDVAGSVQLIGPFAAGTAAWAASRPARRRIRDLLDSTPRDAWALAVTGWLVSAAWMVAFYLLVWAVFWSVTATQATWGGPHWWPDVVGLVATVACSAVGFALGLRFPGRFTAPLAAVGMLAAILGLRAASPNDHTLGIGLLSPIYPTFGLNASVFYAPRPDLAVLQLLAAGGVLAVALAVTAWTLRASRPATRRAGTALLAAGLALLGLAAGLDTTARSDGHGITVMALHNGHPNTKPVAFTPVCSHTPVPVCVHPAYAGGHEPAVLTAAIDPLLTPVRGVPGMPVRAEQGPGDHTGVAGSPPVLAFGNFIVHGDHLQPPAFDSVFRNLIALQLFTAPDTSKEHPTPVQQALTRYLLRTAHDTPDSRVVSNDPAVIAAADRFAALTPAARLGWLTTHLAAVRAGHLTPTDLP